MKKTIFLAIVALLLSVGLVGAVTQPELNEAKSLIDSKADCKSLSNSQLEIIGEYYMEQMHPEEAHERMHEMMGLEEGSEAEEQVHITMARTLYCGESNMMGGNMMGSGGMMGGLMRGDYPASYNYGDYGYWDILWILSFLAVVFLIGWFVYEFRIKNGTISETPFDILRRRFAEGKITKKEFEMMKKEVRGGSL